MYLFPIVYFDENSSRWRIDTESRKELLKRLKQALKIFLVNMPELKNFTIIACNLKDAEDSCASCRP